jgi:hypothetical protein
VLQDDSSLVGSDAETESGPVHTPGSFQGDDMQSMEEVCGKKKKVQCLWCWVVKVVTTLPLFCTGSI